MSSPIVAVLKIDQSIRLCGDYKLTVNKCTNLDSYTISKIKKLTHENWAREENSQNCIWDLHFYWSRDTKNFKKFLTINTHRGLNQFKPPQFLSQVCPWQYIKLCMDNLFTKEPHVSYQDDVRVTGSSDSEHLDNQDRVLKKLSASCLRVRLDKCKFMAQSITYLSHRIDSEGLHPTEDKIQQFRDASAQRNVTELKAFLGLFQFYSRYVPNVSR